MPLILHIETSTEICSIALSKGTELLSLQESKEPYVHGTQITLLIEAALEAAQVKLADLDAIALSKGPGSYTALRIGTSTAKGIGYALDKPLIAIDSLKALALASKKQSGESEAFFVPMIDARRMEVYTTLYGKNMETLKETEAKIIDETSYQDFFNKKQVLVFSGNGAPKCQTTLDSPFARFIDLKASASHLIPLAVEAFQNSAFADLAYFSPHYFKSPNITKPKRVL